MMRSFTKLLLAVFIAVLAPARSSELSADDSLGSPSTAPSQPVKVTKAPPKFEIAKIDPENPPPVKKQFAPESDAFTYCRFTYSLDLIVETSAPMAAENGKTAVDITVQSLDARLALNTTIYLPANPSASLRAHEDGHRQIGEACYAQAGSIARGIASKLIGVTQRGEGETEKDAQNAAADIIRKRFGTPYLDATSESGQRAHDLYDLITQHGRQRKPTADEGVRMALQQYREEILKKSKLKK